jgi:hypothetical protein
MHSQFLQARLSEIYHRYISRHQTTEQQGFGNDKYRKSLIKQVPHVDDGYEISDIKTLWYQYAVLLWVLML